MRDAAPPPLSRRTTAVVATGSLVASVVLLALTIPRGVGDDQPSVSEAPVVTVAKGTSRDAHLVTRGGRDYGALPVGDGRFVTSISAVADTDVAGVRSQRTGNVIEAQVVTRDERLGIAVVQVDPSSPGITSLGNVLASLPAAMLPESGMRVVHPRDGTKVNCHPSLTLESRGDDDAAPVTVDVPVTGVALVTDAWGTPLGVVVDRAKGHWMISGGALQDALDVTSTVAAATSSGS